MPEVAAELGAGRVTVWSWTRDPDFADELAARQLAARDLAGVALADAASEAVTALRAIMASPDPPPGSRARVAAAEAVLRTVWPTRGPTAVVVQPSLPRMSPSARCLRKTCSAPGRRLTDDDYAEAAAPPAPEACERWKPWKTLEKLPLCVDTPLKARDYEPAKLEPALGHPGSGLCFIWGYIRAFSGGCTTSGGMPPVDTSQAECNRGRGSFKRMNEKRPGVLRRAVETRS